MTEGAILDGDKKARLREYLAETKRHANDSRAPVIPSKHYPGDERDANTTKAQHAAMVDDPPPLLREIMGWKWTGSGNSSNGRRGLLGINQR